MSQFGMLMTLANAKDKAGKTKGGSFTVPLTIQFDWFGISCMTTDNFCFYLQRQTNPNPQNRRSMV
jgi:hypothetical protein